MKSFILAREGVQVRVLRDQRVVFRRHLCLRANKADGLGLGESGGRPVDSKKSPRTRRKIGGGIFFFKKGM
jgi:hypothetical protein